VTRAWMSSPVCDGSLLSSMEYVRREGARRQMNFT
jgi:hypothetical protein